MRPLTYFLIATALASPLSAQDATEEIPDSIEEAANQPQPHADETSELEEKTEPADQKDGVVVRIEIPKQIRTADNSKKFKILSPWAPKPLQAAPIGWRYIAANPNQSYKTSVNLKSGKKLSLKITPYLLVPERSPLVVQVLEPGYSPAEGYRQQNSVTATLETSNQLLLKASNSLVDSISNLEELLLTLPKPEVKKTPQP